MTKIEVHRDESGWWIATSPDVPGMVTQARRLDQIEARAKEAVAVALDIEPADVAVELVIAPIGEFEDAAIRRYRETKHEARRVEAELGTAARSAAQALIERGLSVRDAGVLLDISFQRVQQLVDRPTRAKKAASKKAPKRKKAEVG